jgi:hypothetical protein
MTVETKIKNVTAHNQIEIYVLISLNVGISVQQPVRKGRPTRYITKRVSLVYLSTRCIERTADIRAWSWLSMSMMRLISEDVWNSNVTSNKLETAGLQKICGKNTYNDKIHSKSGLL